MNRHRVPEPLGPSLSFKVAFAVSAVIGIALLGIVVWTK